MGTLRRLVAAFEEGFFPGRRLRRRLRKAPRAELGTLEENTFARITGMVRPFDKRLLEAPLSGRLCVYYAVQVISAYGSRRREAHTEIGAEQEGMSFQLEDDTATAVIDPDHARIDAAFDFESESKGAFDADERQRALLLRLQLTRRDWWNTDRLLYREAVIEADERIALFGAAMREPDPDAAPTGMYRDGRPQRLRFTGTAKYPLVISDDPRTLE
jgi:hypothetical protein